MTLCVISFLVYYFFFIVGQLCSKENVGILSRHRRQEGGVIRPDLAVEVFIVVDYAAYFL